MSSSTRRAPAFVLLGTAVLQAVSIPFAGFDQGGGSDPALVPPGPFFAIWGVVVLGCLLSAALGLTARRAGALPWRRIQVPLALVQILFAGWLLSASTVPVLTVPIFLAMLALLVPVLLVAIGASERLTRYVLGGTVGVYAGWTSAAVWINAVTVLPDGTFTSSAGRNVQVAAVIAATLTVCAVTVASKAWPPYVLAGAWALIGVLVSGVGAGERLLWSTAAAGLLAAGLASVVGIRRRLLQSSRGAVPASAPTSADA